MRVPLVIGVTLGFVLMLTLGAASAREVEPANVTEPRVELATAVAVTIGADALDTNAVAELKAIGPLVNRGTAFQLDDGRIATVAHAMLDARRASIGPKGAASALRLSNESGSLVAISRLHDLSAISALELPSSLAIADEIPIAGSQVLLAGFPEDGRLVTSAGTIIARTSGLDYGIGRPDVFVIDVSVDRGWSGGPVVDTNGDVVAIIVGLEQRSGVTLAVPIEYLPFP